MKKQFIILGAAFILALSACDAQKENTTSPEAVPPATDMTTPEDTTAAPAQTPEGALYVCPMHPEVTSDMPGKCGKCGMDLEKKS